MRRATVALAVAASLSLTCCYTIHIRSGRPPGGGEPAMKDKLRSQVIGDIVTIDQPDKLPVRCPGGWAQIDAEVTPFNWLLDLVAGFFYHGTTVTLRCAAPGPGAPPAAAAPPATAAPPAAATPPAIPEGAGAPGPGAALAPP